MFAQADDAPLKPVPEIQLACQHFILDAWHVPNHMTLPFDTNRVRIMDVTRFAHQPQPIADVHAGMKALALIMLKAGDKRYLYKNAWTNDFVSLRKCKPGR